MKIRSYSCCCWVTRLVQSFLDIDKSEFKSVNRLLPLLILWRHRGVFPFLLFTRWLCDLPPRLHATSATNSEPSKQCINSKHFIVLDSMASTKRLSLLEILSKYWLLITSMAFLTGPCESDNYLGHYKNFGRFSLLWVRLRVLALLIISFPTEFAHDRHIINTTFKNGQQSARRLSFTAQLYLTINPFSIFFPSLYLGRIHFHC